MPIVYNYYGYLYTSHSKRQLGLAGTNGYTLNCWFQSTADTFPTEQRLIDCGYTIGYYRLYRDAGNTLLKFSANINGNIGTVTATQGAYSYIWYFVSCVYTKSNSSLSIYINGAFNNSATHPTGGDYPPYNSEPLCFGGGFDGNSARGYYLTGCLAGVSLHNYAMNATTISKLYNVGLTGIIPTNAVAAGSVP